MLFNQLLFKIHGWYLLLIFINITPFYFHPVYIYEFLKNGKTVVSSTFCNFRGQTVEPLYSSFVKQTSPYPHPTTLGGRSTTCPPYSPGPSTPSTYRVDEGGSPSPLYCIDSPRSVTSNSILSPVSTSCSVLSPRDTLAGRIYITYHLINHNRMLNQ